VRWGSDILQIGSKENPYFEDLMIRVMSTSKGEKLKFVAQRPQDAKPQVLELEPRREKTDLRPMLGISPSSRLQLAQRRGLDPKKGHGPSYPGSAAGHATPGFDYGDIIIGVTNPDPKSKFELPVDPRYPEQRDYFEFSRRMSALAAQPVTVRVLRGEGEHKQ